MRFILKQKEMFKIGDTIIKTRFLWLPKKINGEVRWLEKVSWRQKFCIYKGCLEDGDTYGWQDLEWI